MLAEVHLTPYVGVPITALCGLGIAYYASLLLRAEVPRSRRWIRGVSLVLMAITLGLILKGSCFLDSAVTEQKREYAYTWAMAICTLFGVVMVAAVDFVNSMRLLGKDIEVENADFKASLERVREQARD